MQVKKLIMCVVFLAAGACICSADWFEDFESYNTIVSDDIILYITDGNFWEDQPDVPWHRYGSDDYFAILDPAASFSGTPLFSTYVPNVGGNNTKMLWELWYGTYAWYHRSLGAVGALDNVVATAEVAVAGPSVHTAWPLANHIMVGGVAIGISANKISYSKIVPGQAPAPNNVSIFTPVGNPILVNTWYEVKIVYYQMPGANNDIADIYYRQKGTTDWVTVVTDFATGSDLGTELFVVGQNGPKEYLGFIDNISVAITSKSCGDPGTPDFLPGDINKDCNVNLADLAELAYQWYGCTDPANLECVF